MKATMSLTVSEIAVQNPRTVRVFESFGIDYCCGGKRPLQEACELAKVPLEAVLGSLAAVDEPPVEAARNWRQAEMRELIRHIVEEHHGYIRRESPRLVLLLQKVVNAHKAAHPEVKKIQELFAAMSNEMVLHMMKEENMLFPLLSKMEAAAKRGAAPPKTIFGSVEAPISRMLAEHGDQGEIARRIRALTDDFQLPADACPTYRALYDGLVEFERDLHQHVHLENNILFPRALELERRESAVARS